MTKVLKSKYQLFRSFEEDIIGHFIPKLKRRHTTRELLAFYKILNKVGPVRISDLLLKSKKFSQNLLSQEVKKEKKFLYFYGLKRGCFKSYHKRVYRILSKNYLSSRFNKAVLFFEARVSFVLIRLGLFILPTEAHSFVCKYGVLVNNCLTFNPYFQLRKFDILAFRSEHRNLFKKKFILLLSLNKKTDLEKFFLEQGIGSFTFKKPLLSASVLVFRELKVLLTSYPLLYRVSRKQCFYLMYGFPRYFEPNFNTLEFLFYGRINPTDFSFPFKSTLEDRYNFFSKFI